MKFMEEKDDIICPHCNHKYDSSYSFGGNDFLCDFGTEICENCNLPFYWERVKNIKYKTSKDADLENT